MVKSPETLARARALAAGDGKALKPLLAAWRNDRSAALADVIERFGTDDSVAEAIVALAEKGPSRQFTERALALVKHEPDPRIASALVALVEHAPFTAGSLRKTWRPLFAALVGVHADPRSLVRIENADIPATFGSTNMGVWMIEQLSDVIVALRELYPNGAPRIADEAAIAKLAPPRDTPKVAPAAVKRTGRLRVEDDLLAQIAAAPDDDGPRLVYADLVAEQGDAPRAELIQLQLARAKSGGEPTDHEKKLIAKHAATWLAPIVPVVKKGSWRFERGFLDRVTIYPRQAKVAQLAGHPLWSTVRHVRLSDTGDPAPIVVHPIMRNLRITEMCVNPRGLLGVVTSMAPIEELHGLYMPNVKHDAELHRQVVGMKGLPKLRYVELGGLDAEDLPAVWSGGLDREGMQLVIVVFRSMLASAWAQLAARGPKRATVTIAAKGLEARVTENAVTVTLSPHDVHESLWDVARAVGLVEVRGDQTLANTSHTVKRIAVCAPVGWTSVPAPAHSSYPSLNDLFSATVERAKTLGIAVTVEEGTWPRVKITL